MTSSDGMAEGAAQCGGLIGLVFMALSAVSFSIMSLLVHVLARSHGIPSFEAVTARALVGACMAVLWARHAGAPLLPESDGTKRLLAVSFGLGAALPRGALPAWVVARIYSHVVRP